MYKKAQDVKRFLQRKSHHKVDEEREKVKKDLFAFTRCVDHGFPSKPSSLAYDSKLKLIAVGTKNGAIRIFGRPGVEFSAWHKQDCTVNQLFFLQEQGRLVSLCSDNSLHLWEINPKDGGGSVLEEVKELNMETNKLKTVSACCLSPDNTQLLLGTEGGNIHILDLTSFTLTEQIYQDVVMQNVPDDFKINPGAVEDIAIHPAKPDKFLIGYNRGLVVLWDNQESQADKTYNTSQQLESLSWHRNGEQFMSAHSDGSYIIWSTSDSSTPKEPATTPYGPFPCKAISKIEWKSSKMDPYIVFSGGMPRASYGDRHTVSMMQGQSHVVFDFTSRIIDFTVLSHGDEDAEDENAAVAACPAEYDDPHTLVVLAEEELVVVDMETSTWPTHRLPYANSLHSSAITCAQHVANIPDQLWTKLTDAGTQQMKNYSTKDWPITGGKDVLESSPTHDLLLTGHEDGTVRFWDASSTSLSMLYKLSTAQLFGADVGNQDNVNEEEEWPPFRKVGTFDPYSDDPRLGIQRIALCPLSETLVVAGTAGQVMVMQMEREERTEEVSSVTLNIVNEKDNFVWKGHEALVLKQGEITFPAGFQPVSVMQLSPPAACSALAFHSEWQLVAAGTAHGFGLFDYRQKKEILTRCTLNPLELTGGVDTGMSRRKSFKKSLRDSFRRLRRRRSEKKRPIEDKPKEEEKTETTGQIEVTTEGAAATGGSPGGEAGGDRRPVERQVEARTNEDQRASLIRCLYFTDTFISSGQDHTASLWAGSNAGHVFIYTITVPATDKRATENVNSILAKEIKLRHRAPVISISVLDKQAHVLPDALEVQHQRVKEPDMSGDQQVIICSEEQFKIFSLPHLKPVCKVKLTAADGSRVRKVSIVRYRSKADENYTEYDASCLTNQGELLVYTLPHLRRQARHYCLRKEDISGISSFIFTKTGQGFYLGSASEFSRISLSIREVTQPECVLELKDGMRPPPPEPAETVAVIEITPPEGEAVIEGGDATVLEVSATSAPDEQNDSRADTTADITVDSVVVNPDLVADESIIASSERIDTPATTEAHDTSADEVTVVTTSDPEPIEMSVSAKLAELNITSPAPASNETTDDTDLKVKNPRVIEPEITVETTAN